MNRKSSVLAIDPGYDRVGMAVFEGMVLTHSECFTPKTKDFSERLLAIHAHLSKIIKKI